MITDEFGARMKRYENVSQFQATPKSYLILRVDGRSFHTYTKGLDKPYDTKLATALDTSAQALCKEAMGCQFAYGQSDEYSFLLTDFERHESQQWLGGCIQKLASIGASIFTEAFSWSGMKPGAHFDCRAFVIPTPSEVEHYFIWRQQDAVRNSLNLLASHYCSIESLIGASSKERHEALHQRGINWATQPSWFKQGRCMVKLERDKVVTWTHKVSGEVHTQTALKSYWGVDSEIPVFTKDRGYLNKLIPKEA